MADDGRIESGAGGDVAANPEIRLWQDRPPPSSQPGVGPETTFSSSAFSGRETTFVRNVSDPTLTVFAPDPAKANGVGVIVCPGGAWRVLAWQLEGIDPARWLAARGYTAFLLKYRVRGTPPDPVEFAEASARRLGGMPTMIPGAKAPRAMADGMRDETLTLAREVAADDGRRAVEIVREQAVKWGITPDRIGMIGFSAGAFLAADLAMEPRATSLAFVAPIYGGETRGRPVPADAPALFTAVAQDDRMMFRIVEGLYADWCSADRPAELHVFTRGGHGFGIGKRGLPVDRWSDLLGDWLADLGLA